MLGAYEMTGLLEAQYGPYETIARRHMGLRGFGDAAQPSVADDFLTATRKATCVAMNHTWDEQGKVCIDKVGGKPVDAQAEVCKAGGWVWDDVAKKCLTPGSTPTPPPGPSTTTIVALGALGLGALYFLTRKKR